ncbi:hypothetical protein AAY84_24060 [Serratia marcescens]|uniref:hypothetical protein n=1 Tax=Serratia marcescens TaxID=615 RepID=UPI00062C93F1|nr:hypothetical protein [Serratia marcescens]KKZ15859.1 hypothetical protein AAY84_24060 [Serratia marcescens]
MAKEFIWDESSVQVYTKDYGTQKLTPYQHDSLGPFWKDPGADFTMDAEGEILTLVVAGVDGDENNIWWPSEGMTGSPLNMNIINGNLVLYYEKNNTLRNSGIYFGNNTAPLYLTLNNSARLDIISCPFVFFSKFGGFKLAMSGSSHFNIESSTTQEAGMLNIISGAFNLTDSASFSYEFPDEHAGYKAALLSFLATVSGNAKMTFTDNTATTSKLEFASGDENGAKFNINGDNARLAFMAKGHPLFGEKEIAGMNKGTFNFITKGIVNNSEIVLQNAGKDEMNAFWKTGAIAIDDQPQYDDKNLNFDYDDALPGLRISVKH